MGAKSTSDAEAKAAILFLYNTFRAQRGRYGNAFTYIPRELEKFRAYARNVDGAVAVASMMKTIQRNGGFAHVEGLLEEFSKNIVDLFPREHPIHKVVELERAIDEKLVTKQIDMADAAFRTSKARRALRINISSQLEEETDDGEVLLTLRLEGRLHVGGAGGGGAGLMKSKTTTNVSTRKFTSFFKSILVEFFGGNQPEVVEWNRQVSPVETDGFEIRRKFGRDAYQGVRVHLQLDQHPPKYRLSPELAEVLDHGPTGTKPAIVLALWQYIKLHKLQESDEKKLVNNDAALQRIFGVEQMSFSAIPVLMERHLLPLEPILLEHLFNQTSQLQQQQDEECDKSANTFSSSFDLEVELVEDAAKGRLPVNSQLVQLQRDIGLLEGRINEAIGSLRTSVATHRILDRFARDPIGTSEGLLAGLIADQECLGGEAHITMDQLMRGSLFTASSTEPQLQQQHQNMAQAIQQIVSNSVI